MKITLSDVKKALKDSRFRLTLPNDMIKDVDSFLENPGCACNAPLFRKVIKECRDQLSRYYPGMEVPDEEEELNKLAENRWSVINCDANELEIRLKKLGPGRKQIAVARFEDKVTVVINELDVLF